MIAHVEFDILLGREAGDDGDRQHASSSAALKECREGIIQTTAKSRGN